MTTGSLSEVVEEDIIEVPATETEISFNLPSSTLNIDTAQP